MLLKAQKIFALAKKSCGSEENCSQKIKKSIRNTIHSEILWKYSGHFLSTIMDEINSELHLKRNENGGLKKDFLRKLLISIKCQNND